MNSTHNPVPSTRRQRSCGTSIMIGLGILLGLFFTIEVFFTAVGGFLIIADPLERSDAVVVLSGGGRPRMEEAYKIYSEKYAKLFVLTETGAQLPGSNQQFIFQQKLDAMDLGVPIGAIRETEAHAEDTSDEAKAVLKLLQQERAESAIIVTDPFHTQRTRFIFNKVFEDSGIRVNVRPVRGHWYRSATWWTSPEGWRVTIQEYAALLAYWSGVRKP